MKTVFRSRLIKHCVFNKRYRKCVLCFCIFTAYLLILRAFSSEFVSIIYVKVDSAALPFMFTRQNETVKYGKHFGLSTKQTVRLADKVFSESRSHLGRNITKDPEYGPNVTTTAALSYLIENKDLCMTSDELLAIIIVHTAPKNYNKRMAIRKSWANNSYYSELGTVRTLFLLGQVMNESLQEEIDREFKVHSDLLQGNFIDSYYNITLKGIMAYKWLYERCSNVKIILKVDDDVIINMFTFLKYFAPKFLKKEKHMACRRLTSSRIDRNKKSKWYVSTELLKDRKVYPPFCQGFAVIVSNDAIAELYKSSLLTPFFWIDDVFLYGFVPGKVTTMNYSNLVYGKNVIWGADKAVNCYKRKNCDYLVILLWSDIPNMMEKIWSLMQRQYLTAA